MPKVPVPTALAGIKALWMANYVPIRDQAGQMQNPLLRGAVRVIDSQTASETLTALGSGPGLAPWGGELRAKRLAQFIQTVVSILFDATVEIPRSDFEDDTTGQHNAAIIDMGARATYHPSQLLAALLEANPAAFDGLALFHASRVIDKSGTINNLLTPAMVGDAPTVVEYETAVKAAISALKAFKNDAGEPVILAGRFATINPTGLGWQARACAEDGQIGAAGALKTNEVRGRFEDLELPFLTSDVVMYTVVTDVGAKPVVLVEREALEFTQTDEASDEWKLHERSIQRARARRVMAPGAPWLIVKSTFTKS